MSGINVFVESCRALLSAESDEEKLEALVFATPCIQSNLVTECRRRLFDCIGPNFLKKMISGQLDVLIDDDEVELYRLTGLNILVSFVADEEFAKDGSFLRMAPDVFELLRRAKKPEEVLEAAVQYFRAVVESDKGRRALVSQGAVKEFSWMYSTLKSEDALHLIKILVLFSATDDVWSDDSSFHAVMTSLAHTFAEDQTSEKFIICENLYLLLSTRCKVDDKPAKWAESVLKGLRDILTSRIDDEQRAPALKLASAMVTHYGLEWAVSGDRKFQLLLVCLSSIECRMQMEDQPVSSILENVDLVSACLSVVGFAVEDVLIREIQPREKDQIVESYSAAASAVVSAMIALAQFEYGARRHKDFVYAMIKFLSAGFVHDVLPLNSNTKQVLPFMMKFAEISFQECRKWFEKNKDQNDEFGRPVDLFDFLIPAMAHLIALDGQQFALGQMDSLLSRVVFFWEIVKPPAPRVAGKVRISALGCLERSLELIAAMAEVDPEAVKGIAQLRDLVSSIKPAAESDGFYEPLIKWVESLDSV